MKTEWDYSSLADAYLKRPDYSDKALDEMVSKTRLKKGSQACDIGAGVAHLTLKLANRGFKVRAIEPNNSMRKNGIKRTEHLSDVSWFEAISENTQQPDNFFDIVTFGSSFNVANRQKTLIETNRILKPGGWFACMWNHRNLDDSVQQKIEQIIKDNIPDYSYGTRREDQTNVINKSGLFFDVIKITGKIQHEIEVEDCIEAWKSHATLERQAKDKFPIIVEQISSFLKQNISGKLSVPYITSIWMAQTKK